MCDTINSVIWSKMDNWYQSGYKVIIDLNLGKALLTTL